MSEQLQPDFEKILINVSGHRFEVLRSTLEKFPDTLLGSDSQRKRFFDEKNQEYYFDRDPEIFRHILNYYRTGKLNYPMNECLTSYDEELTFFGIRDGKRDNTERLFDENSDTNLPTSANKRQRMWRAFEHPHTSNVALTVYYITGFFIAVSFAVLIGEILTYQSEDFNDYEGAKNAFVISRSSILMILETACMLLFTVEYLLRLIAAPSKLNFIFSFMSLIDIITFLPSYVSLLIAMNYPLRILNMIRVLRILKFARYSLSLRVLGYTIKSNVADFCFMVLFVFMNLMSMAIVMFHAEGVGKETNFMTLYDSLWYAFVTMTTLGYGDMVPYSKEGKIASAFFSVLCILAFGLFLYNFIAKFNAIHQRIKRAKKYNGNKTIVETLDDYQKVNTA